MDCPVCKDSAMITMELNDIEIDHCLDCGGIWLDGGELELLLGDMQKAQILLDDFQIDKNCKEKPRKCPICYRKMHKIVVGTDKPALLIDKCPKNDGLWFDKGELAEIVERAKLDPGSKINQVLHEMFPDEQNE